MGHESGAIGERRYIHLFDKQRTNEAAQEAMASASECRELVGARRAPAARNASTRRLLRPARGGRQCHRRAQLDEGCVADADHSPRRTIEVKED
jgi:hypothetical protein